MILWEGSYAAAPSHLRFGGFWRTICHRLGYKSTLTRIKTCCADNTVSPVTNASGFFFHLYNFAQVGGKVVWHAERVWHAAQSLCQQTQRMLLVIKPGSPSKCDSR